MVPPHTRTIGHIALIYRIYFLYIEPLAALGGTYLCYFNPDRFLSGTVPLPAYTATTGVPGFTISPLLQMMLTNIGSLYMLFAINEGVVLRLTNEKNVWLAVMLSMVMADTGHLYAAYAIDPQRISQFMQWNSDEWINYGTLMGGFTMRILFLLGFGRS
jgi:hypothetical protein